MLNKMTRAEQKAQRPYEILEAAFEEFSIKGYAAARLDDIAKRIGISKGTIYLYFPTKEALFEAMTHHHSQPYRDVLTTAESFKGSYSERLRALLLFAFEKISKDKKIQQLLRLSLTEGSRFPEIVDRYYQEFVGPLAGAIGKLLAAGVAAGEFRAGPATSTPEVIMGSILHLMILHINVPGRRRINKQTLVEAHLDLTLNGVLAHPS
ncbi:Fatty acid metabolism regulator protein [Dickeya dianthicola]|uniref:TetR/AcrR family transcriptional regulator n=1 Tax=Dickeya dianthicola TaxID=204039 RepID=A0AAP6VH86_9GAMM|nr:TetR/AcrR family transcriptional regulator [Dickeya dianthicola]ATO32473.1 Transcriptional regulator, TetR family [Dickeya dianthicola RNS04.9]AYC18489.1 Fatty acid metabolism regulator protein [Dickeya dianthicola]MBI0438751.1 TetR/AcrR family transcriptional regulator [Dickeya dianthicola]MBI0449891.1 TetR/AcrR family transcriptional regulator [Dickeya dianthicola]MBI0454454.1 TetR/AcrR family transcriptional regulator [Dickeya dianthicola]